MNTTGARKGESREERSARVRETILCAAAKVFGRQGFDGTSLNDIASRCGVGRTLILHYFGNKDELWERSAEMAFDRLKAIVDGRMAASSATETMDRLHLTFGVLVDAMIEVPEYGQFLVNEGREPGPRMQWLADNMVPRSLTLDENHEFRDIYRSTMVRAVTVGSLLSATTLGPLMDAGLASSRDGGGGIVPLTAQRREELITLLVGLARLAGDNSQG